MTQSFVLFKAITVEFTSPRIEVMEDAGSVQVCARISDGNIATDFGMTLRAAIQARAASEATPPNMRATGIVYICGPDVIGLMW